MLESQEAPGFLAPRLSLSYPYGVYQQEKSTFIKVNYNLSTYTFNLYSREAILDVDPCVVPLRRDPSLELNE